MPIRADAVRESRKLMTTRKAPAIKNKAPRKVVKLKTEAFRLVELNSTPIIQGLVDASIKGHVLCTRLLLDLAEDNIEIESVPDKKPVVTVAMRLAAEPQLPPDHPDPDPESDSIPSRSVQ